MHKYAIRSLAVALTAGALLMTAGASAQDRNGRRDAPVTEHNFTDADQILGDTVGPDGWLTTVRRPGNSPSLIRYRTHFRDSLLKSVESL